MFERLKQLWTFNYITIDSLRKWVEVNKLNPKSGITEQEFEAITKQRYEDK